MKRFLLAPVLAMSFVLFRIGYAFVFNGLGGSQRIFTLPEIRLFGPFRQVLLFGPVSWDGIVRNIETALPFAASIMVFGLLAALIGPRQLRSFGLRFPAISWLSTTLGVALATISQLAASARKLTVSRRLRGESRFAILVPLFERTLSASLATGLELARSQAKNCPPGELELREFQVADLKPVNLKLKPGEVVLLTGPTGSGKSTMLRAIAGEAFEADNRQISGKLVFSGKEISDFAIASAFSYLVPQLPLGLAIEGFGSDGEFLRAGEGKNSATLSHGEAYRFALDRAMARAPRVILLDEPSAALDEAGIAQLRDLVRRLSAQGSIVLIAEHRAQLWDHIAARQFQISNSTLLPGAYSPERERVVRKLAVVGAEPSAAIRIPDLTRGRVLLEGVNLDLRQGQSVAIVGSNGTGKSTLLNQIAWPITGQLKVHGIEVAGPRPSSVALVPDQPSNFFVTESLGRELARADRVAKAASGLTRLTLESILGRDLEADLETHPLDLSVGTQLALACSMQLSHKPSLLLLDEPVQGLDPKARGLMAETIRCVQETGCAVLFATHDLDFATALADTVLQIRNQRLIPLSEVGAK
jgi:energy-coupling factor transport system ATP-binding protein